MNKERREKIKIWMGVVTSVIIAIYIWKTSIMVIALGLLIIVVLLGTLLSVYLSSTSIITLYTLYTGIRYQQWDLEDNMKKYGLVENLNTYLNTLIGD